MKSGARWAAALPVGAYILGVNETLAGQKWTGQMPLCRRPFSPLILMAYITLKMLNNTTGRRANIHSTSSVIWN